MEVFGDDEKVEARLFGEDLPATFEDGDEIWVYRSAGLDILSDGTYDLEVRPTGTSTSVLDLMGLQFENKTVYTVLMDEKVGFESVILKTSHGFDLAPSNIDLAGAEPSSSWWTVGRLSPGYDGGRDRMIPPVWFNSLLGVTA